MIVTWCLCDACGDLSQICALKLCIWSLHMRLVLPLLNHKVQSYILGKKISNLHESLSWEPTPFEPKRSKIGLKMAEYYQLAKEMLREAVGH